MALPSSGKGRASPASRASIIRLWAWSRAVYTTPDSSTVSPARRGARSAAVQGAVSLYSMNEALLLQLGRGPAGDMAGNVDGDGQAGYMGGHLLDGQAQAGGSAAEALRPDAQRVDLAQQLLFQRGVIGVGVGHVQGAQQGLFGQVGHLVKAAAHPDAQDDRRAGVGAGLPHRIHHT